MISPTALRFHKHEINGSHQTESRSGMVPVKFLMLEDEIGDQSKHH
jgi:hypothetical protein